MTRLQLCTTCHRPIEGSDTSGLLCNCYKAVKTPEEVHGYKAIDFITKYLEESPAFAAELKIAWARHLRGLEVTIKKRGLK